MRVWYVVLVHSIMSKSGLNLLKYQYTRLLQYKLNYQLMGALEDVYAWSIMHMVSVNNRQIRAESE